MTKTMRIWLAAVLAVALMTLTAAPSSAARPTPVRSGTITGWGMTGPAMFSGEAWDCRAGNPECLAWLKSGCNPALTGREPAVTASIEDVAKIANGTTPRVFKWRATSSPGDVFSGGVVVQMWTKDCKEINSSKWRSAKRFPDKPGRWTNQTSTTFRIPSAAKWMTVTTNDSANLKWTLT
ncbi:MAG TPA: hypothetical protein VMQ81_06720 [Acidimicrobiia bacterium]|nr:hypothetical protein [Acidimicrobiia bacterium]